MKEAKPIKVLSLGGSLIVPEKIDLKFLQSFRDVLLKNTDHYKFIIICGGGTTARKYITALSGLGADEKSQGFAGISATRMNARFMNYLFGIDPERGIPHKMNEIKKYLKKQDVVFCGALSYGNHETSDSTSVEVAEHFKADFINLTDVPGLYNKNPKKFKNTKLIKEITWQELYDLANKIEFKPGQHFVIDQTASKMILDKKIPSYILGKDMEQLDNFLQGKPFIGTTIKG
jgi:uridylate kinase